MMDLTYKWAHAQGAFYLQTAEPSPATNNNNDILVGVIVVLVAVGIVIYAWSVFKQRIAVRREQDKQLAETPHTPPIENRASTSERFTPGPSQGDIFISYASPDRPTAATLAAALTNEGWSVWWDRTIPPGKSFDEVIEAALTSAKCVIVLWSKGSVTSDWVKVEAAEAARRRILIPAVIEEVTIPLEFRRLQAADLVSWQGSREHAGLQSLMGSIVGILGMPRARNASP